MALKNGAPSTETCGNANSGSGGITGSLPHPGKTTKEGLLKLPGTSTGTPAEGWELVLEEDAKCSKQQKSCSRLQWMGHSRGRSVDKVLGKTLPCFLHPAPCPLESLQNIVDRALLAEASQSVQYTLHALPQGTVLQKGFGLLQAIEPERDAPCGLCPETKAAEVLSLEGRWYPDVG